MNEIHWLQLGFDIIEVTTLIQNRIFTELWIFFLVQSIKWCIFPFEIILVHKISHPVTNINNCERNRQKNTSSTIYQWHAVDMSKATISIWKIKKQILNTSLNSFFINKLYSFETAAPRKRINQTRQELKNIIYKIGMKHWTDDDFYKWDFRIHWNEQRNFSQS